MISTPAGTLLPDSHYDITLTHDGHVHVFSNALVRAFTSDGRSCYEFTADGVTMGFLPEHVSALALKL